MAIANITNNILTDSGVATSSLQIALNGTGFVKISGTTISYDNSTYALDSAVVKLTGTQTVGGAKTFSTYSKFDGGVILKNNVSASLAGYVGLSAYSASGNKGINIDFDTYSASFYFSGTLPYQYTFPAATGTIALTSDLSSYLPLAGGTLTGALGGTSAIFSSSVTAAGATFTGTTAVASTGGTSQMRIDRSGSVARIQNYDTGSAANISLAYDGGNVGIGTSSPLNKLDIVQVGSNNAVAGVGLKIVSDAGNPASIALSQTGRGTVTIGMAAAGAAPADFVLGTDVTGNIIFKQGLTGTYGTDLTTGNERMRITSGGEVAIGRIDGGGGRLGVRGATSNGAANAFYVDNSSSVELFSVRNDGVVYLKGNVTSAGSVTATSFFESSSIKGKNIIATNPLLALNIDVIKYTRKSDESKDIRYGYSAEQIHSLMPELTDKDVTAVKYLDVHTILIAQLQKEIKELKAKMN